MILIVLVVLFFTVTVDVADTAVDFLKRRVAEVIIIVVDIGGIGSTFEEAATVV